MVIVPRIVARIIKILLLRMILRERRVLGLRTELWNEHSLVSSGYELVCSLWH